MSKEITISERLKKLRARHGFTQEELAAHMGFTRSYLSQLESGVKDSGPKFMKKLLECEQAGLADTVQKSLRAAEPKKAYGITANAQRSAEVQMIPLISWAQAGLATTFELIPDEWQERIPAVVQDPKAFAIALRGDSMEPRFQDGDVAIVLPQTFPRNGDLVVANIKEEGFALKILTLIGGDPKRLRLSSYNQAYPPMDFAREQFHWIYPVHSVNKLVRR